MKYRAKPEDQAVHGHVPLKDLLPYREYKWNEDVNRHGTEEWNQLKNHMHANGWQSHQPLQLVIDRADKTVHVGEGNHRLEMARQLFGEDYMVPVCFNCRGES